MVKKNFITGIILAGVIAITGTTSVFAIKKDVPQQQNTPETSNPVRINPTQMHEQVKSALDGLVKKGTITKTQEDAVLKAMAAKREKFAPENKDVAPKGQKPCKNEKCKPHGRKHGVLKDLVQDGTITQEQAEAIREAIRSARDSMKKPE